MDFTDLGAFVEHPRVTALTVDPAGRRVVVAVQQPDRKGAKYLSALWELDPDGKAEPRRLTFSATGESAPRFAPDGTLLFTSARPDAESEDDTDSTAIWRLPEHGEARVVADTAGGLGIVDVAADGTILASTSVLAGGRLAGDAEARQTRKDRAVTAILHTGMPIRYWDHEIGDTSPRVVLAAPAADGPADLTDLAPGADTLNLLNAGGAISPDGSTVALAWTTRVRGGETVSSIVLIDTGVGDGRRGRRRRFLAGTSRHSYAGPSFAPDGTRLAVTRYTASSPADTNYPFLEIHRLDGGDPVTADVGDLTPAEYTWAADGQTLFVAGDLHSRGAVLAVDPATGAARTLADDAAYTSLAPTADGRHLFALRSTIDSPPTPVRLTVRRRSAPRALTSAWSAGELPGRLEWVDTDVDGVAVGGWLCTPATATRARPAPLMVWVHGGPHASYNSWSWRWCPWLAVARGYAVLMSDPAMSTGYGQAGLNRGWPRRPDVVWGEVEALADQMLRRTTLDGERTALLGASFGGFMTNWIAGQTDRFSAIVTHAGLYALDQQHATTDMAAHKVRVHRTPAELPEWYAAYSPHHHASRISTPMLVTHGNKDYRVPVSEALRLWWDLVSGFDGRPADLPHRFLQLTGQNHWVLTPADARVWNQVVLDFCDHHVRGVGELPALVPAW